MKPTELLKQTTTYLRNIEDVKRLSVVVGLPAETVGGEIYGDGKTIVEVGASHEYGVGLPTRSFLRLPFALRNSVIVLALDKQFDSVMRSKRDARSALSLVGVVARNIVLDAFRTGGFGQWPDITQWTKDRKRSSKILIDTGTLRNSITWVIR